MRRAAAPLAALLLGALAVVPARAGDAPEPAKPDTRGYVGIGWTVAQRLSPEERQETGITLDRGVVVNHVTLGSPAMKAGVQVGDVPISLAGVVFPPSKDLPADDDEALRKYQEDMKAKLEGTKPGETIEVVLERAGKRLTLSMVAIDREAMDALAEEDRRERDAVKVPKPEGRGEPRAGTLDFEAALPEGESRPAELLEVTGFWEVAEEEGGKGNHELQQTTELSEASALALWVADGRVFGDAVGKVRVSLRSGERSVSAGLVARARDRRNYYAAVVDGVAQTFAIVKVVDGQRKVLASVPVKSPRLAAWHALELSAKGEALEATFAGTTKVSAKDADLAAGWWGVTTAEDSHAAFDDLSVAPAAAPAK